MYVSPFAELIDLTKLHYVSVTVLQRMLKKITSAMGPFPAPESTESKASWSSLQ